MNQNKPVRTWVTLESPGGNPARFFGDIVEPLSGSFKVRVKAQALTLWYCLITGELVKTVENLCSNLNEECFVLSEDHRKELLEIDQAIADSKKVDLCLPKFENDRVYEGAPSIPSSSPLLSLPEGPTAQAEPVNHTTKKARKSRTKKEVK